MGISGKSKIHANLKKGATFPIRPISLGEFDISIFVALDFEIDPARLGI